MKFTKYNNPNKKRYHKKHYTRTDADIIACKNMLDDRKNGVELPLSYYDKISDNLCNKPSRNIYK